ncbi:DNA polymerase, partial [Streptococcus suis]
VKAMVKETMESAISLSVPLIADENEGSTWYEEK